MGDFLQTFWVGLKDGHLRVPTKDSFPSLFRPSWDRTTLGPHGTNKPEVADWEGGSQVPLRKSDVVQMH